jgi:2-methylfumaryl-CoA isomerase
VVATPEAVLEILRNAHRFIYRRNGRGADVRLLARRRPPRLAALRLVARMTGGILAGMRIVEGSAFVAAPLGGMTLAQLGADVIRFDPIGGGLDHGRWPLSPSGKSLFWAGLNKGKRSIRIDLSSDDGQEIAAALITHPGPAAGIFLTNLPPRGRFAYDALKLRRTDLVMVSLAGNPDGSSEVDYTVNPATGLPMATGPRGLDEPVNSLLPAWDIAAGTLAAVGVLAADRHRTATGEGSLVNLALSDVAFAMVGNLGRIAQAQLGENDQEKDGNFLYGAFGRDFRTRDGRRVMVVALTRRQWNALLSATGIGDKVNALAAKTGIDLDDEGGRFACRDDLARLLEPWFAARDLDEVRRAFANTGVSWGPYQTFRQLVSEDPRASAANAMFQEVEQPGIGVYLAPGSPLRFSNAPRLPAMRAPALGENTDEILGDLLGLPSHEIARLHDKGIVAGANQDRTKLRR